MKLFRKIIDERQELEMMRVERVGFWLLYLGLVVAIIVQLFVFGFDFKHLAGEFIVLIVGCVVMLIGYMRRGSWDYFTKPGMKSYIIYSLGGGLLFALPMPIAAYFYNGLSFLNCLSIFAINFLFLFSLLFLLLWLLGSVTKRRQKKLEQESEEE